MGSMFSKDSIFLLFFFRVLDYNFHLLENKIKEKNLNWQWLSFQILSIEIYVNLKKEVIFIFFFALQVIFSPRVSNQRI